MVQRRSSAVSTVSCTLGSSNWRWHTVEGSVSAQDVTVCGRVKRTIRAVRVKLQDGGAVEGDTLPSVVVDRRELSHHGELKNPANAVSVDPKGPRDEGMRSSALAHVCGALKHRHPLNGPS
jgi:hypothetical protein